MNLEELYKKCNECRACSLHKTKTNTVFGVGRSDADIMFVGEAPGENEDLTGEPFVGRAGKLFDKYLDAVGIKRENIYIANILKCRPPKNRDPQKDEEEACMGFLREQVRIINPSLIVCLGRISAMRLIKPDFKITAEHGVFFEKGKFMMTAVYHPSALLRDPHKKDDMLKDMEKIKEYAVNNGLII
ncbi:MAG: uracil-DNA glycosylase [Clostridia bacterium]|nr:uracil-DNA glycosylase [Clostridia bacterium]